MVSKNTEVTTVESATGDIFVKRSRVSKHKNNAVTGIEIEILYHRATKPKEISSDFGHRPKEYLYSILYYVSGQNVPLPMRSPVASRYTATYQYELFSIVLHLLSPCQLSSKN